MPYATCRIVLINPPQSTLENQPLHHHTPPHNALTLAAVLVDAGFNVSLLDARRASLSLDDIRKRLSRQAPQIVVLGHTETPTAIVALTQCVRTALPQALLIDSRDHAHDHWQELLETSPDVHFKVRGHAPQRTLALCQALDAVLAQNNLPPSRLALWIKTIEAALQRAPDRVKRPFTWPQTVHELRDTPRRDWLNGVNVAFYSMTNNAFVPLAVQILDPLGLWRSVFAKLSACRVGRT